MNHFCRNKKNPLITYPHAIQDYYTNIIIKELSNFDAICSERWYSKSPSDVIIIIINVIISKQLRNINCITVLKVCKIMALLLNLHTTSGATTRN